MPTLPNDIARLKKEITKLVSIRFSYSENIVLLIQIAENQMDKCFINELNEVYFTYMINGIYKVIKEFPSNITLRSIYNKYCNNEDEIMKKYYSSILDEVENEYKDILNYRSEYIAHIDSNPKQNANLCIEKIFEVIDKIRTTISRILIELFDDGEITSICEKRYKTINYISILNNNKIG